jgi:hypothetical protein
VSEIYSNITDKSDKSLTLILGIEKPALRNFGYNNIQMIVGNDFDFFPEQIDLLDDAIVKNGIESVNIIGMSKTCTSGVVYASALTERFADIPIKLFLFCPYTTIDERFYRENNLLDRVPRSLKILWRKQILDQEFLNYRDVKNLEQFNNIQIFVIYPLHGVHCEPQCVSRIADQAKVTLVPLSVGTHAVLLPFWNQLKWDLKIEAFENEFAYLSIKDYWYYSYFQKEFKVKDSLYELMFDHRTFLKQLDNFNEKMEKIKIPFSFTFIFTCIQWKLETGKFVSRNIRKINRIVSRLFSKDLNKLEQKN